MKNYLHLVQAELSRSGFEDMIASGIVLTGGASIVEGVLELSGIGFSNACSIGLAQHVSRFKGCNPKSNLCYRCWFVTYMVYNNVMKENLK